jgi:hypothetical protein
MTSLMPLWELEQELTALLDSIDVCPPELQPELEQRISQYLASAVEKVDKIGGALAALEAVQANARTEIDRLRDRQQSAERSAERLKEYIIHLLRQREGKPLRGRNVTLTLRRSEAVVIDDLSQIPDRFKRVTVTTDVPKTPIREAIKSGTMVPGAHIEQHENLIRK